MVAGGCPSHPRVRCSYRSAGSNWARSPTNPPPIPPPWSGARGSPAFVDIAVRDQGMGIAPEILDRVCDPFFTTKPEGQGTGLGLSVSLGIVRGHGGTLSFADTLGGGATVVVRLPEASDA